MSNFNDLMADLLQSGPSEDMIRREQRYRRGYHHGWENAIDAIFGMIKTGMSKEEMYSLCALYVNGLAEWRTHAREGFNPPPSFHAPTLKKVQEYKQIEPSETDEYEDEYEY